MKNAISTWSGGKDCCLALYLALEQGYKINQLFNTISDDYQRVRFHGLKAQFIQAQAQALELPIVQASTSAANYEQEYIYHLSQLGHKDASVIYGDINNRTNRIWAEKVARQSQCQAIFPLWDMPEEQVVRTFIDSGFTAHIISVDASILGPEWIGSVLSHKTVDKLLQHHGISIAGEQGEFHTVVTNGPIFKYPIQISIADPINIGGFWFGDVSQIATKNKSRLYQDKL